MKNSSHRRDLTNIFSVNELPVYLIISSVSDANDDYKKYLYKTRIRLVEKNINNDVANLLTWNVLFLFLFCIQIH